MADTSAEDAMLLAMQQNGDIDLAEASQPDLLDAQDDEDDDDDEYDPSSLVPDTTTYEENAAPLISTPAPEQPSQAPSRATSAKPAPTAAPTKPRTVGGFAVDDSSDEEDFKPAPAVTNGSSSDTVAEADGQPITSASTENISQAQAQAPSAPATPALPDVQVTTAVQEQPVAAMSGAQVADALPTSSVPQLPQVPQLAVSAPTPTPSVAAPAPAPTAASPVPTSASAKPAAPTPVQTSQAVAPSSAPTSAKLAKPVRLPSDRVGILEDRIEEDPRGDIEAWLQLIAEHRSKGRLDDARATYDRFFEVFPHAADEWVNYIKMETEENSNKIDSILSRSLMMVPHAKLWSAYLDYVRRKQNLTTDTSGNARATVAQTFDFVLSNVGMDRSAGQMWVDYLDFLKSAPGNVTGTNPDWKDLQKIDALRKAYQKAVVTPTLQTNSIWNEYTKFEMELNKVSGRKYLQEKSPSFVTARSAAVYMANNLRELDRTTLPRLPPAPGCEGEQEYMHQVQIWKAWLEWEKSDPLEDKATDVASYRKRVLFTYKQALMALRFWPEIWYEAAEWCFANDLATEGTDFLSQGAKANPESLLLAFKQADRVEAGLTQEEGEEALKQRGLDVRAPYDRVLEALYDLLKKVKLRVEEANAAAQQAIAAEAAQEDQQMNDDDDDEGQTNGINSYEETEQRAAAREARLAAVKFAGEAQIDEVKKLITTAWIALMRAMRRVQGKGKVNDAHGIGGSRQIFADCRKKGNLTSDIYIAAALMEHHAYKDVAGTKIFERGLKLHPEDEHLVLEYLKHLITINDVTNARAVFEATISRLATKPTLTHRAKPLLLFFHTYESQYGELSQIQKVEKRMADLFPNDPTLSLYQTFEGRFRTDRWDPLAVRVIVSPKTQARPRAGGLPLPSTEGGLPGGLDVDHLGIPNFSNSPKRTLDTAFDSDTEATRPRKLARGESPLAGAAGRRLAAAKHGNTPSMGGGFVGLPVAKPLPVQIRYLLEIIPAPRYYDISRFSAARMVELLRAVDMGRANLQIPSLQM